MTDGRPNDATAVGAVGMALFLHPPLVRSRSLLRLRPTATRIKLPQALVLALILLAMSGGASCADDETSQSADDATVWPDGAWTPVSRELLQRFLIERAEVENAAPPTAPFIERIVYRGELQDDLSFRGEFDGIVRSEEGNSVLDLRHVSMFLGDLRWEDQPAEWGSTEDGRSVLMVPEDASALVGRWSLAHRVVGERIEFRVQTPPAAASRFELSLPAGWRLESSTGTVFSPSDDPTRRTIWIVELGRRDECLWTLERADTPREAPLMLMEEQSHVYSISEDRCQIHAGFEVRVLRGPVREFRFVLPGEFQYSRTTYTGHTGNISLTARLEQQDGVQILVVPLPELSAGLLKTVEIDGTVPSILDAPWQLPTISLLDARTMQSTRRLRVEAPLAVSALEPRHLRQTEATFSESGVDWSFEELSDESALNVQLVVRKPRVAARVACRIDEEPGDLRCDALVRLNTQSGTWYDTEFQLPADWEVFDVVSASGLADSAISYWRVSDQDTERRLRVEFRQAASLQSPKSILIRSRAQHGSVADGSRAAPIPVPVAADDCRVLLFVARDDSLNLTATEPLALTEIEGSDVDQDWRTELAALGVAGPNNRNFRFFESVRAFRTAILQVPRAGQPGAKPAGTDDPADSTQPDVPTNRRPRTPPRLTLTLRSRLSVGDTDSERHEAVFQVVAGQCSEAMSFGLVPDFSPGPVLVDGEPAEYSRHGDQIELTGLDPGVKTIEIRFSRPVAGVGWLSRRRLSVIPPASRQKVTAFRWEVQMPRGYRISREPAQSFLCSGAPQMTLVERFLGPFFEVPRERDGFAHASGAEQELVTFSSVAIPDSLSLRLWNVDKTRAWAWVVFLASLLVMLLLRQARVRYRHVAAISLIFVSATLAATLDTVPALLSGSMLMGVILAVLAPRRLTVIFRPVDTSSGGRVTQLNDRVGWTTLVVAICCALLASLCTADDDPQTDPAVHRAGPARVIVPYGDDEPDSVVYVDTGLARELAAWIGAADRAPQPLLRTARYFATSDAGSPVRAEIDVLVPTGSERVPVRLPFAGVTFQSTDDCLVNGVPTPLRPASDGRGMIVEVINDLAGSPSDRRDSGNTDYRSITLSLQFRPHSSNDGTAREARLPVMIDSRLLIDGDAAGSVPQVFHAGSTRELATGWEVELGPVGVLSIGTENPSRPSEQPAPEGQAVSLIVLQPRHAWVRTRLDIGRPAKTSGPGSLQPQVIELAGQCDVREVASQNLQAFHVRYPDSDRTIVELVFDQSDLSESVVRLDYTRPSATDGDWRFPDVIRIDGIPLAEHLVGVASSRGFLIDADRAATDVDGVRVIAPETFVERVSEEPGWTAPNVAYQLTPPIVLPIQLDRLRTERSAGVEQTITVSDNRTTWLAELSMNVAGAPATQHRIRLSPVVQVESVSVVQDGAERLLSWSQNGRDLVIFLTGDRTGTQEILLRGLCTNGADELREVPTLEIPQATIGKLQTAIENRSGQALELLNSRGELSSVLSPVNGTSESPSSRTFDADSANAPARFRIQPRRSAFALEALVAVSTTQMAVGFRSPATSGVHEWELVIPAEWDERFNVEPSTALVRQRTGTAGQSVLTLRAGDTSEIVTLATPLSAPDGVRWTLPTPVLHNVELTRSFVAVSPDLPFVPVARGMEPDPAWQSWLDSVLGPYTGHVVPVRMADCILKRRVENDAGEAAGMLFETLLFGSANSPAAGQTTATVMTHQRELVVVFSVPEDVELASATFDGGSIEPEWSGPTTVKFRVVNDEPIGLAQFVLNWRSNASRTGDLVTQSIPGLIVPTADRKLCLVVPSTARQVYVSEGITPLDRREFHFNRAECLVRILEQVVPGHIEFDAASRTVTARFAEQLQQHLEALSRESLGAEQAARMAAIRVEWDGIRALMGDDWQDADPAGIALESGLPDPPMLVKTNPDSVAGTLDPTADRIEFIDISQALMRGLTVIALLSGLVAACVLIKSMLPSAWRHYLLEGDTLLGAAVLGLLWWWLLPLGPLGLAVCVISLMWEIGSVYRMRQELRHSV